MSNKKWVIKAVRELPEEASIEEILEHIQITAKIRRSIEDSKAGRVISHEELVMLSETWITKYSGRKARKRTLKK